MNKVLVFIIVLFLSLNTTFAESDKFSQEYLQTANHFSPTKFLAEAVAEKAIKTALKKETGANFDVALEGYTTSSIKKGIFKSLELSADNVKADNLEILYVHLKSLTDYNYVDYTKNPMEFKSDMTFGYDLLLSEDTINEALKDSNYSKTIAKVNKIASPLFVVKQVRTKIIDNRLYIITDYNFPLIKSKKDKSFVASSEFQVTDGVIKAKNVSIDSIYGDLGLDKVANLINYLNPLEFTLRLLDNKKYDGIIENVNIVDNKVKVDGKIFVKGGK